jgi:hypothetical protein
MDIIESLRRTLNQSTLVEFNDFVNQYPKHGAWHIISDYCIDDKNKIYDSITFSVLANHDSINNIKEGVKETAPKDFKNTRTINVKFQRYINSQVFYHFTFLLEKKDKFYKEILNLDNINALSDFIDDYADTQMENSPDQIDYWISIKTRLNLLRYDMKKNHTIRNLLDK